MIRQGNLQRVIDRTTPTGGKMNETERQIQEGWATVVFLLLMLLCVAWSIQAARWTEAGLDILQAVVLLGGGLGIVLAKSRTPRNLAHSLSLLTGATWGAFLTARILARTAGLPLTLAVRELELRIWDFLIVITTGESSADNLIFLLLLGWLLWPVAYTCAWAVFRWRRVWWAVILGGVALLINLSYARTNLTVFLIGFLLSALLLVVRTSLAAYEQEWRRNGVSYSPELISGFLRAGLLLSILAIVLAWLAPKALASRPMQQVWDRVGEPWRKLQDESARIFQNLNYQNEPPLVYSDRWTRFGGPVELTDTPVADIQAPAGRYWRVMVFHEYTGDGWHNTDTDLIPVEAGESRLAPPEADLRREISQTVTLRRDLHALDALIAAGQPLRANVPIQAAVSYISQEEEAAPSPNEGTLPPVPGDPSVLYARQPVAAGQSYQVLSSLSTADEESLRRAGTRYPDWVTARYLQLPDSLPERVRLLAERLTAEAETPYDKAKVLEAYLRRFPYDEKIKGPATDQDGAPPQDGVDYFLFEEQAGYCDYYASAMVVMLRAVGVPARYVRGYIQEIQENGVYHLLENNAHAWPEVYFPGYGWIEFEPTGGLPPLERLPSQEAAPAQQPARPTPQERDLDHWIEDDLNPDLLASGEPLPPEPRRRAFRPWLALALLLLAALSAGVLLSRRRQRRLAHRTPAERAYGNLTTWTGRLFHLVPSTGQTPHEYARAVARLAPAGRPAVERIADLFVRERFGGRKSSAGEADLLWRQARQALQRQWWADRLRRIRR